jgi:eukaryotic-like serine/threonine-protein kinase
MDHRDPKLTSANPVTGTPEELPPGTVVGSYVVLSLIASGGGGMVYRAQHNLLGRKAAVKVLRREIATSPEAVARFLREAQVVNFIRHPNIVDISEFGQLPDGRRYFVMELLDGTDLSTILKRRGRLAPAEILEILTPLCSALEAAHAAGVVHRDLKASNVGFAQINGKHVLKLLDFGIAKLLRPEADTLALSTFGTRLGTPCAMAPEQIRGETVDHRVDIYSLGVLVYQLLTGRYPFSANSVQELDRLHLEGTPPRPSHAAPVPVAFDPLVLRCMEKDPRRRFPSVAAFLQAFSEIVRAPEPVETPSSRELDAPVVYVEVRTGPGAEQDERLLDDICTVLDLAEQTLRAAGFELPLCTGSAVLGILTSAPEASAGSGHLYAQAAAEALARQLAVRGGAHPAVWVNVTLHAHRAVVRASEVAAGDVLSISGWIPQQNVPGVHLSPQAQQAVEQERQMGALTMQS